jgi:hypothetical protein
MQTGWRRDRNHVALDLAEHLLVVGEPWNPEGIGNRAGALRMRVAGGDQREPIDFRDGVDVIPRNSTAAHECDAEGSR